MEINLLKHKAVQTAPVSQVCALAIVVLTFLMFLHIIYMQQIHQTDSVHTTSKPFSSSDENSNDAIAPPTDSEVAPPRKSIHAPSTTKKDEPIEEQVSYHCVIIV